MVHSVATDDLIDAVCHVELVHVTTVFSQVGLFKWCLIELLIALLCHLDELHSKKIIDCSALLWVNDDAADDEFLDLLRNVKPDWLLEVKELFMTLVSYSSSDEQVYKDPDGPGIALWTQLVLHDFRSQIDAIDTGNEVDTAMMKRLGKDHCSNVRKLNFYIVASLEAILYKNHLR